MVTQYSKISLLKTVDLSLSDRRLLNYLLIHAFNDFKKKSHFKIHQTDLEGVFGINPPSHDILHSSLLRLQKLIITFMFEKKGVECWAQTALLSSICTEGDELKYCFPELAIALLKHPKTLERILIQAHFECKYSFLLYELLSDAIFANKETFLIEITFLRKHLNINENKLRSFNDLNRFAIQPALEEINAYASFCSEFTTMRKGRKVTHIDFQLTNKRIISNKQSIIEIIPPKRPKFFIQNPKRVKLYSDILMASTTERKKYFKQAIAKAKLSGVKLLLEEFDTPDTWFKWINVDS